MNSAHVHAAQRSLLGVEHGVASVSDALAGGVECHLSVEAKASKCKTVELGSELLIDIVPIQLA
jgi:hypothetical protein